MKQIYVIYSVQITGALLPKGKREARNTSVVPCAVVASEDEAEFCCEEDNKLGIESFYIRLPVLAFSKSIMQLVRKTNRDKKRR